jgi:hypothetical protein
MVFRAPGAITLHDISTQGDVLVSFDRVKNRIEIIDGSNPAPQERSWREDGFLGGFSNSHMLLINNQGDSGGPKGSVSVWQPNEAQPIRIGNGLGLALAPDSKALIASSQAPSSYDCADLQDSHKLSTLVRSSRFRGPFGFPTAAW